MPPRLDKTIVDYVVIAIIPALIMCLVGSLVFFLLTVFYHGQYEGRLHFIFAMFVLAAVLIARISMEEGIEYATLFAVPLAIAAGLAMLRFVEIQGPLENVSLLINLTLLGLVWWSAHKLTWDCTLIDEHEDATGQGLMQTIGLDDRSPTASGQGDAEKPAADHSPETTTSEPPLRRRWQRFVESQRRPHAPGVWVVYFSLAALPIFGVGQRFIPSADVASRQDVFRLLFVYVASGLGLLLTTSFLGLRRYLRQRQLEMSADMARTWLVIGSVMIVLLMVFCTLLPRPSAEYAVSRLPFQFGSPADRRPSRFSVGDDGPRDDRPSTETRAEHDGAPAESDNQRESETQKDSQPRTSAEGKADGESPDSKQTDSRNDRRQQDDPGEESDRGEESKRGQRSSSEPRSPPDTVNPVQLLTHLPSAIGGMLKFLFYVAVIAVVGTLLWKNRDRVKAAWLRFLDEMRQLWGRLFGRPAGTSQAPDNEPIRPLSKPRPFSDFADPFTTGLATRYSAPELIRYSFEALEAWARERGCSRQLDQTPTEFAQQIGRHQKDLGTDARNLARLYSRAAYAQGSLPASTSQQLKQLWSQLG